MQGGKQSLAWNSVYLALDEEAAHGFSRLAGPRARTADKPPASSQGSGIGGLFRGCFCGAPPSSMKVRLEIQDAAGTWNAREVPDNLSAIMIENLPKRWASGDDFWEGSNSDVSLLTVLLVLFCFSECLDVPHMSATCSLCPHLFTVL